MLYLLLSWCLSGTHHLRAASHESLRGVLTFDSQGYLSFWNDNISYALRGCILIELALRRRIALVRDPGRRRIPLAERVIEVIDERQTGETLLDEALRMMKGQQAIEKMGINSWIDLLSGTCGICAACVLRLSE